MKFMRLFTLSILAEKVNFSFSKYERVLLSSNNRLVGFSSSSLSFFFKFKYS